MVDKASKSVQVLSVQLHVVVASALHPQWFDCARCSLVDGQAVGEIDDLIVSAVDHEDSGGHSSDLLNAARMHTQNQMENKSDINKLTRAYFLHTSYKNSLMLCNGSHSLMTLTKCTS